MSSGVAYKVRGEGPTVVFLHGVGGASDSWDPQLASFGEGFRAVAWDMPGYGGSAPVAPASFENWAAALARLLDDLRVDTVHLVGHSIGGMIAQQFMIDHADRVDRLVLSATSPAFGNRDGDFQRKFIASRLGPLDEGKTMAELAAMFVPGLVGPEADSHGVMIAQACMSRVTENAYRMAMKALVRFDLRTHLGDIAVPTLLLAGANDPAAPPKVLQRMAEAIPGSEYACIDGAGHLANLEKPADFDALVRDFLERAA